MKKEAEEWLKKGEEDFKTAEINFKNKRYDAAAFFVQQSVEKALKALEIEKLGNFDKTHDLYFLGKKLKLPQELLDICDEISEYYVETRYPDTYAVFTKEKVSDALKKSGRVRLWIREKIL